MESKPSKNKKTMNNPLDEGQTTVQTNEVPATENAVDAAANTTNAADAPETSQASEVEAGAKKKNVKRSILERTEEFIQAHESCDFEYGNLAVIIRKGGQKPETVTQYIGRTVKKEEEPYVETINWPATTISSILPDMLGSKPVTLELMKKALKDPRIGSVKKFHLLLFGGDGSAGAAFLKAIKQLYQLEPQYSSKEDLAIDQMTLDELFS